MEQFIIYKHIYHFYFFHFRCANKQNCSVLASTNMFGDPCPGTHKYLEAHYQCISGKDYFLNTIKNMLLLIINVFFVVFSHTNIDDHQSTKSTVVDNLTAKCLEHINGPCSNDDAFQCPRRSDSSNERQSDVAQNVARQKRLAPAPTTQNQETQHNTSPTTIHSVVCCRRFGIFLSHSTFDHLHGSIRFIIVGSDWRQ